MATSAISHATYVNRDQEKDFTPAQQTAFTPPYKGTHARARMVPQQNNEKPRPAWAATCQQCGQAEEMPVHLMTECPILKEAHSHHFDKNYPITFLFNKPEVGLSYLRFAGLTEAGRVWSLITLPYLTLSSGWTSYAPVQRWGRISSAQCAADPWSSARRKQQQHRWPQAQHASVIGYGKKHQYTILTHLYIAHPCLTNVSKVHNQGWQVLPTGGLNCGFNRVGQNPKNLN